MLEILADKQQYKVNMNDLCVKEFGLTRSTLYHNHFSKFCDFRNKVHAWCYNNVGYQWTHDLVGNIYFTSAEDYCYFKLKFL